MTMRSRLARHITLRQLEIFAAVARLGGYTRAAEELHLTQPTVSMQVRKLAEAMGAELFETRGRALALTPEGERLLAAADDIFDRLQRLEEECQALSGEVRGNLRIAAVTTAKYFLPRLLGEFLKVHPGVEPHLAVTNRARVIELLRTGAEDLIVMGRVPAGLEVEAHPFLENELVVVAPPDHPLREQRRIPLARIAEARFLVREPGSGTRTAVDNLFAEHGLNVRPTMELGSSEAIKQAVLAGLGVSVLPLHNIHRELKGGDIIVLDVEHFPLRRRWYAVHLKGRRLSLVAQAFLDFLTTEGRRLLAA
jgi:DNA-binding transcriptional LysR family regulator